MQLAMDFKYDKNHGVLHASLNTVASTASGVFENYYVGAWHIATFAIFAAACDVTVKHGAVQVAFIRVCSHHIFFQWPFLA